MLKSKVFFLALSTLTLFGHSAFAGDIIPGTYLSIEGQIGDVSGALISQGSIAVSPAEFEWQQGISPSEIYGARLEAAWQFEGQDDWYHRIGIVYSGSLIDVDLTGNYYGAVLAEPRNLLDKPVAEISVCPDDGGAACSHFEYQTRREFHEIKPEFMLGANALDNLQIWLGLQPFLGVISEQSSTGFRRDWGVDSEWNSHFVGGLFATEAELAVSEKQKFLVGAGIGPYLINSESRTVGRRFGTIQAGSDEATGLRAQLSIGTEYSLNSRVSLGLIGRMDYWSDMPNISGYKDSGTRCVRNTDGALKCEPPRVENDGYKISFNSMTNLFVGVKLTFRTGL